MRPFLAFISLAGLLLSVPLGATEGEGLISSTSVPEVLLRDAPETEEFRVVLAPRHTAVLSTQVASTVMIITKEMGEAFESDVVLVQLDDTVFLANEIRTESLLAKAEAQLAAKEELFRDNVASVFELKDAQAAVASAKAELTLDRKNLEACSIQSPYAGRIVRVLINEYEMVQPGAPLVEVVDDTVLFAKLLVPSDYFNELHQGQILYIRIEETGTEVPATVSHIGSVIDPASSMFQIYAEVNNSQGRLRSGMIGSTEIETPKLRETGLVKKNVIPESDIIVSEPIISGTIPYDDTSG